MIAEHFLVRINSMAGSAHMFAAEQCGLVYNEIDFDGMVNDVAKSKHALVSYQGLTHMHVGVLCNKNVSRIAQLINAETQFMDEMSKRFVVR